ncbi:hypothetical protein ACHAXA_000620 [Cyclostephanos tholiformis]|uniref:Glycosyltransferase family 92 protein n=1 Tax=Cyclostephanos tholiformis TaxID=382380 RepID=A0ABD3SQB4_9STRA
MSSTVLILDVDKSPQQSVLLAMTNISKDEYDVLPGIFDYGVSKNRKHELVITTASITGDYHNPDALWFQFLGMGGRMFRDGNNFGICKSRSNDTDNDFGTLKQRDKAWEDMQDEEFFCRIGGREARLLLMPTDNYDANTHAMIQVFRCPLRGIQGQGDVISAQDMDRLRYHTRALADLALKVEVIHKDKEGKLTQVARIVLPLTKPSVGIHRILSDVPVEKSFLSERHNITLCLVSHPNGILRLNEWIRYHQDIVGIDHIHLGLFTNFGEGNGEKAKQVHYAMNNLLFKSDVRKGALSVSPIWDEDFDIQCDGRDLQILSFYQECLYRAKGTSEFVGTWDLDEFFLFNITGPKPSISEFLRTIVHPKCQDWSFVTMKSSSTKREVPDGHDTGLVLFDHPTRDSAMNKVWLKSIARTEKCFQNSPHILGACLPQGTMNISGAVAMHPDAAIHECAFMVDRAFMVHARDFEPGGVSVETGLIQSIKG